MAYKPSPALLSSYQCIRGQRDCPAYILNESSYRMAEFNERTGRFTWMRLLPMTQREAVEKWVRSQFAPPVVAKVPAGKVRMAKATKNVHAAALGRLGGVARKKATTRAQRSEIARNAANARWSRKRKGSK